jgi:hypothetical protein
MKFIRSDVRHICFKRKNGFLLDTPLARAVYGAVEPALKKYNWGWNDFTEKWDVSVKPNSITPVKAIKDLAFITEVSGKAQMLVEMGIEKDWTHEELAIIHFIESQFLEGKMTWANYKKDWNISWDHEYNRVVATLIRSPGQIRLTKEDAEKLVYEKLEEQFRAAEEAAKTISSNMMSEDKPLVVKKKGSQKSRE